MMIGILLLIIFLLSLAFFGWQAAKLFLKEERIEALIPLSLIIGLASYIFLLNISSYFIPIRINFYLVALFLLGLGSGFFFSRRSIVESRWGLKRKEAIIIFGTVFLIMILNGLLSFRSLESDELAGHHLPLAVSIASGNFPVQELNLPGEAVIYHYGYNLFLAALFKLTNLAVWFAHDFNVFLFSGLIFLLLFLIAKFFLKDNLKSYLVALIAMFGGGFKFLYGIDGAAVLFKTFILDQEIAHPFKFLSLTWESPPLVIGPLVKYLQFLWAPFGWALTFALIYLFLVFLKSQKKSPGLIVLIIVLLSVLALHIENFFAIIFFGLLVYLFIFGLLRKDKVELKKLLISSLIILVLTGFIVLVQGGTISGLVKSVVKGGLAMGYPISYSLLEYPLSFYLGSGYPPVPFYGQPFIFSWGLLYFLIIPASIFILKKYFKKGLFLVLVGLISFLPPFIINFNAPWQDTMNRFFFLTNPLWGIIVGLFLIAAWEYFRRQRVLKSLILLILIIIPLDGVFWQLSRPFYPFRVAGLERQSFAGRILEPTPLKLAAYQWVKEQTGIQDYFLVFGQSDNLAPGTIQNYEFIFYTQRLAPIYSEHNNYKHWPEPNHPLSFLYRDLIKNCDNQILKELQYKYLFVDNNWPKGLENQCLVKNDLALKFSQIDNNELVRIYLVK